MGQALEEVDAEATRAESTNAAALPEKLMHMARRSGHPFPSTQERMSPTARRLLEAARRLLERSGLDSLTYEAIGREAGETSSLIRYHFGDKAGLLVALIDWVMYEDLALLQSIQTELQSPADAVPALLGVSRALIHDTISSAAFFDLLPHLIRDESTQPRLAELYAEYRRMLSAPLAREGAGSPNPDLRVLAALSVAVTDGLMVQQLVEPGAVDIDRALRLWQTFMRGILDGVRPEGVESSDTDGDDADAAAASE